LERPSNPLDSPINERFPSHICCSNLGYHHVKQVINDSGIPLMKGNKSSKHDTTKFYEKVKVIPGKT
jgi:hypothetical protein